MKLESFCHVQREKLPTVLPPISPISPRADLKALSLIYTATRLEPPQEPLALKSVIFRQLNDVSTILPTILNSKHLACIVLRTNTLQGAEPLEKWLEGSPFYPFLRTFDFGVRRHFPDTLLSTKLLPFLSNHSSLTYLDIDLYVDGIFGTLAAILRQMKSLDFFGFATIVKQEYLEYESLFKYLYPLLSALPSRLGGLEIDTRCMLMPEVRGSCATKSETTRTNSRAAFRTGPSSLLWRARSAVSIPELLPRATNLGQLSPRVPARGKYDCGGDEMLGVGSGRALHVPRHSPRPQFVRLWAGSQRHRTLG